MPRGRAAAPPAGAVRLRPRARAHGRATTTSRAYEALVARLRARVPGLALSTDVIVGFPGEDEDDFAATEALVRRVRYDSAFLFKYSPREGTRAFRWDDTVPEAEKARRLERLIALQETISAEINRALARRARSRCWSRARHAARRAGWRARARR